MPVAAASGGKPERLAVRRAAPFAGLGLLVLLGLLALCAAPSLADTPINNTTISGLLVLKVAYSPYTLDHDLHVAPGGFLLVSDGVALYMENGSTLFGDGGSISATGSAVAQASIGPRPAGNFSSWGGIELRNGSALTLRHAKIVAANRAVAMYGIAALDAQFTDFAGCWESCVSTARNSTLSLRDCVMADGAWALIENGSLSPLIDNITVSNFSAGGFHFAAPATGATVRFVSMTGVALGVLADGLRSSSIGPIFVAASGAAVRANATQDVTFNNATLQSSGAAAFEDFGSARILLRDSTLAGAARALSLTGTSAGAVINVRVGASSGSCLYLLNVTNALFRGTALDGCARTLEVDPASAPPTADADRSNTVDGRAWLWIASGAFISVGVLDDPGLLVLSSVAGANVSDLHLTGAGVNIFGSSSVLIERVLVEGADAGLVAIGTRGLTIREFVARNVTEGIRIRTSGFFASAQDIYIDSVRIDGALGDGIAVADATNVTVVHAYARAGGAGANFTRVQGLFVQYAVLANSSVGLLLYGSTGVTVVDSVFAGASAFGLLATNSTGHASRNAFLDNAVHASAPGSPSFPFYEAGGGNYWKGFTSTDANLDGFYDTHYDLPDATGSDFRPRVARFDFRPTVIVLPPGAIEVGALTSFDASYSFDDFGVGTVYWTVDVPGRNDTASGPFYPWRPNASGNFTLTIEAVDTAGATSVYSFTVLVRDTTPPVTGDIRLIETHVGGNATFTLANATDNDRTFPANATISWTLTGPSPSTAIRRGEADSLTFQVPIDQIGNYTLLVRLFDRRGNSDTGTVVFGAFDSDPPDVEFLVVGDPDLGVPFLIDLAQATDPAGIDGASARWSWLDGTAPGNATGYPSVLIAFRESGNHTVTLRLCDQHGNCGNTSVVLNAHDQTGPQLVHVRVIATGKAPVDVAPQTTAAVPIELNKEVVFEIGATDRSEPMTFTWTFPDGTHATGSRVTKTFTGALGPTVVTVTMTDALGNGNTTAIRLDVGGGGTFIDSLPGGASGLVALVALAAAGAVAFVVLRRRSKKPKVE
jgi:hypothetical protein